VKAATTTSAVEAPAPTAMKSAATTAASAIGECRSGK
jgi:hypothetical protein